LEPPPITKTGVLASTCQLKPEINAQIIFLGKVLATSKVKGRLDYFEV
jgi:hypothetical protein